MRIYETTRLYVREMVEGDLPVLRAMLKDPFCMSAYEEVFGDLETQDWLRREQRRYREQGFGLWALIQKHNNEMVGQCGLSWQEYEGKSVLEIRYLLHRNHWHQGYAIEAARGCTKYAFEVLNVTEVFSIIRNTNIAAMNVAIRNGMIIRGFLIHRDRDVDVPHYVFSIKNAQTEQQATSDNSSGTLGSLVPTDLVSVPAEKKITHQPKESTSGNVDKFSPADDKIALFMSLFEGRKDVYAIRRYSQRAGAAYYMPACRNEYRAGVCGKPKQKCGICKTRDFIPLDAQIISSHLKNKDENGNGIIGLYPLMPDETCCFLAMDFDGEEWKIDVSALRGVCDENKIPVAVERSRSGQGAHVWFFFNRPLSATLARRFGTLLITRTMNSRHEIRFTSYDRLFPNQDTVPKGGFGNLIALPLQGGPRMNGNSVFIDDSFEPYLDQWDYLSSIKKLSLDRVEFYIKVLDVDGELGQLESPSDVDDAHPWEVPRQPERLQKKDFPKTLRCVEANRLFVEKEGLSQRAMNRIKRLAAFPNPAFRFKQRLRLSTFNVPRIICAADETKQWLSLPRGCRSPLESLAEHANVIATFEDNREMGCAIEVRFNGVLRMDQAFAMDALATEDNGVVAAATAFGKTVVAASLIARINRSVLILVHTQTLLAQWEKALRQFLSSSSNSPVEIGRLGGGKNTLTGKIDIATVQSLNSHLVGVDNIAQCYGVIIVDECHHVPALTIERALSTIKAKRVYGLTATPTRKDGLHPLLFMQCGPIRYRTDDRELVAHAASRLLVPRITRFKKPFALDDEEWTFTKIYSDMVEDGERNSRIVEDTVQKIKEGRTPLVLSQRTEHVRTLSELLRKSTEATVVELVGNETAKIKREKEAILAAITDTDPLVIVATGQYVGEGFDMPRLDTLLLAMPVSWKGLVAQYVGRLHREYVGKRDVIVYDYVDIHVDILERMYQKRLKAYAQVGYFTAPAEGEITGGNVIYDTRSFASVMRDDFDCAKEEIVIVSPFIRIKRLENILDWLRPVLAKGITVKVVTRPPENCRMEVITAITQGIETMRMAGVQITNRAAIHQKFVLVDRRLVWYGSLNLLSYGSSEESLMRLTSREVAAELLKTVLTF